MAETHTPGLAPDQAQLMEETPEVRIFGAPTSDFTIFPSSTLQLMCGMGEVGGRDVLVPYLQLRLLRLREDMSEDGFEEALKATVPFENLAFLLMDMSSDLDRAAEKLDLLGSGPVTPEPHRIAYSIDCMKRACGSLTSAMKSLERLATPASGPSAAAPGDDRGSQGSAGSGLGKKPVSEKKARSAPRKPLRAPRKRPAD